jgi:hypothetical protein
VVGALACAEMARGVGLQAVVGGLTWERRVVDPLPGPRTLAEIAGARALNDAVAVAGPQTTGRGGFRFAEARVAELTGEDVVLVDPHPGPRALGAALGDAARQLGCDHVVLLDVGGDVLAHGDEPGLGSPLADAVLLAAAASVDLPVTAALWGAGCDGELTLDEVGARLAEVWAAGGARGALALTGEQADRLAPIVAAVPTEASATALRSARGETGRVPIRDGRRHVELTPLAGVLFLFDAGVAMRSAARLAQAVRDATDLGDADAILTRMGIVTELAYEARMAQ